MAGEFFQSERGQIKAVESQAQKEKKDKVSTELQGKKDLFHTEVGKAGKLLADAEAKLTVQKSKDKVSGYKKDISSTLSLIINSGRESLAAENPDADLAVMDLLAGSLKSAIAEVKQYVPLFHDVEAGKADAIKSEESLKKTREAKKKNGIGSQEFNAALMASDDLIGKATEGQIYLWKPEALPADMQAILMSILGPLKDQEAEMAGYHLERTQDSALQDDPNDLPEGKADKAATRMLKPAKAAFDAVQPNMEKISIAVKESKEKPEKLTEISGSVDTAITDLGNVLKQFKAIDKSKILLPEYVTLYEVTLQKVQLQLTDLASLKVSLKTRELMTTGLTDEEKKYVTMDEKGNIMKTPEFAKLPKDKKMALEAKFKLIEMEVAMELDEKTAKESEKKMIEGRKKLMAGDPFGAKEDLYAYYTQEAKNADRDPVRFEQTREMLKQIAKMELSQMIQRLAAMKASVKERYNNKAFGKTDFGTHTYQQAYDNIDNMALIIEKAEEMIESGECVTIGGAQAKLWKFEFGPNSVQGVQAMDEKAAGIKEKGEEELKKGKEERIKKAKEELKKQEEAVRSLEAGSFEALFPGRVVTPEFIEQQKAILKEKQKEVGNTEGMSLEDERAAQLVPVERELKKARLDRALKSWKLGFPVDMKSNSYEVFDMFRQQDKLNDPNPEVRKQATLEEARKARERGFTGMAKQLYESYFANKLRQGAKSVDKAAVREKTLKDGDTVKKLSSSMETWKKDYSKQWGHDPEQTEIDEALGKMQNMVVSEAYNKEVKLSTYSMLKDAKGTEANEWNEVYGSVQSLENFGQGGVFVAFWSDEEWNALPVKVGVFTAVTIASAGIGSAVAGGASMAARAGLTRLVGQAATRGFIGTMTEAGVVGGTRLGTSLAWAGEAAVEGAVFSAAQHELNGLLMGNGYERFSAEYWKAMGHSVVTMGLLKGIGTGVGKLQKAGLEKQMGKLIDPKTGLFTEAAVESGAALKILGGGGALSQAGGMLTEGAWWLGKTSLEGGAMVGLDAGMAFLSGRHFTAKEAMKSFGENFLFSAAMGGVHSFMGHGAQEAPQEKKKVSDIHIEKAIGEVAKAEIALDKAKTNLEKAKADGKPTEHLEKEVTRKEYEASLAETKVEQTIDKRIKDAEIDLFKIREKILAEGEQPGGVKTETVDQYKALFENVYSAYSEGIKLSSTTESNKYIEKFNGSKLKGEPFQIIAERDGKIIAFSDNGKIRIFEDKESYDNRKNFQEHFNDLVHKLGGNVDLNELKLAMRSHPEIYFTKEFLEKSPEQIKEKIKADNEKANEQLAEEIHKVETKIDDIITNYGGDKASRLMTEFSEANMNNEVGKYRERYKKETGKDPSESEVQAFRTEIETARDKRLGEFREKVGKEANEVVEEMNKLEGERQKLLFDYFKKINPDIEAVDIEKGIFKIKGTEIYGSIFSIIDTNAKLDDLRDIASTIKYTDTEGKVKSFIVMSGSGAQKEANPYPTDIDMAEHLHLVGATTKAEAGKLLAAQVKATIGKTERGNNMEFIEMKLGMYPEGILPDIKKKPHVGDVNRTAKGEGIKWNLGEIQAGFKLVPISETADAASLKEQGYQIVPGGKTGRQIKITMEKAGEDPGLHKMDWRGVDPNGKITEITKVVYVEAPNVKDFKGTTSRSAALREVHLMSPDPLGDVMAKSLDPSVSKATRQFLIGSGIMYGFGEGSFLKAAKKLYSVSKFSGNAELSGELGKILKSPYGKLHQIQDQVNMIADALKVPGGTKLEKQQIIDNLISIRAELMDLKLDNPEFAPVREKAMQALIQAEGILKKQVGQEGKMTDDVVSVDPSGKKLTVSDLLLSSVQSPVNKISKEGARALFEGNPKIMRFLLDKAPGQVFDHADPITIEKLYSQKEYRSDFYNMVEKYPESIKNKVPEMGPLIEKILADKSVPENIKEKIRTIVKEYESADFLYETRDGEPRRIFVGAHVEMSSSIADMQRQMADLIPGMVPHTENLLHVTIGHIGKPKEIIAELEAQGQKIDKAKFEAAFQTLLSASEAALQKPTEVKFTKVSQFGKQVVAEVEMTPEIREAHQKVYEGALQFLRDVGVTDPQAVLLQMPSFRRLEASNFKPHVTLGEYKNVEKQEAPVVPDATLSKITFKPEAKAKLSPTKAENTKKKEKKEEVQMKKAG